MAPDTPLPLAAAILDRSVTVRGSPRRPLPPAQPLSDRAQQRLIRLAVAQAELEAEERDALRVTAEDLRILHDSVKSVKAEFPDLDGLSWHTPAAREILAQWQAEYAARERPSSPGGVPIRRSNAACALSFPASLSVATADAGLVDLTPMPSPIQDTSHEDTIRLPRVDSRRSSSASTVVPDRDGARTPLCALFASLEDNDDDTVMPPAEVPARPSLPHSHSAPALTTPSNPFATTQRPSRPLPPSRIPVRSKSLSAKPSSSSSAPARRYVSMGIRRPALAPSLAQNAAPSSPARPHAPAKRALPPGLSASPRRTPPSPRARPGSASPNKFRIVSAPAPVAIPTRPRAASAAVRVVPGPSPLRGADAGRRTCVAPDGSPVRVHPARVPKRGRERDGDDYCEPAADGPPVPSPTRARFIAGGVPMRRT